MVPGDAGVFYIFSRFCVSGPDGVDSAGDLCFIPGGASGGGGDFFTDDARDLRLVEEFDFLFDFSDCPCFSSPDLFLFLDSKP
ncbi:hypothetical protein Hanom_Chr17g01532711 [Helianthus anomalus]